MADAIGLGPIGRKAMGVQLPPSVLTVVIPEKLIAETREKEIVSAVANTTVEGFRKGKAPRKMVEERLDPTKVREEVLKQLLPKTYMEAITEHNLKPVISPKIHVTKLDEGKNWEYTATTCEAPIVDITGYKDEVQKITVKSKIIIPGKEKQEPKFDEILQAVVSAAKVTIPQILIEGEVERLLSQLLDEIKTLGLSLDQYLASTHKTAEDLKKEYAAKAENDIKFEFILQQIADQEKITVEQKEIDEAIQKAKDDKEKQNLEANRYLLASILRQQKTLDFLKNL